MEDITTPYDTLEPIYFNAWIPWFVCIGLILLIVIIYKLKFVDPDTKYFWNRVITLFMSFCILMGVSYLIEPYVQMTYYIIGVLLIIAIVFWMYMKKLKYIPKKIFYHDK